MDNTLRKRAFIPIYWVNFAIGLGDIMLACYIESEIGDPTGFFTDRLARMLVFLGFYVLIQSSFHWSIHKKFIMIHFLWIPVRIIRWENVFHAEYIYRWSASGKSYDVMKGQGIFVTLNGCPNFCPEVDALSKFMLKHPFRTIFIRFTPRNQQRYVAIFRQYYPELDFQLGYEENLKKGKPYMDDNSM